MAYLFVASGLGRKTAGATRCVALCCYYYYLAELKEQISVSQWNQENAEDKRSEGVCMRNMSMGKMKYLWWNEESVIGTLPPKNCPASSIPR